MPKNKKTTLNNPPTRPTLTGPTSGETGTTYTYTATSTDPEGDNIIYCFDWGDGTSIFCTNPFPSGQTASVTHTWTTDGTYTITCKASDPTGAESEPATLTVSMPDIEDKSDITILKPKNGLYIHGTRIIPLMGQIVIGDIEIEVKTPNSIQKVEFRINKGPQMKPVAIHTDTAPPFIWSDSDLALSSLTLGILHVTICGYDVEGEKIEDKVTILQIKG